MRQGTEAGGWPEATTVAALAEQVSHLDLRSLFDGALDAIVVIDTDSRVLGWNSSAERTFGYGRDEAVGRPLAELIIPSHLRAAHHAGMARYLDTGEGPVINERIEITALHREGHEFPVELTILPISHKTGLRFCGFIRDISKRVEAERKLARRSLESKVLYEVTALVSRGGSTEECLRLALDQVCEIADWSAGHSYAPDDDVNPRRLVPSQIWSLRDPGLDRLVEAGKDFIFTRGEGLPGRIWETGEPCWVIDIASDPNFLRRKLFGEIGIQSAFGFPVFADGRLEAVLEFFTTDVREPEPELVLTVRSLAGQLGRLLERQRALEQQKILLGELTHRVGNTLAVIGAIFRRTAASAESKDELVGQFEDRLLAVSAAHKMLSDSNWSSTALSDLVGETLRPYCADGAANCTVEGPPVALSPRLTMTLSLVLHELATNAAKHGALSTESGHVRISWEVEELSRPMLVLRWAEDGGPPVQDSGRRGFGSQLIKLMLSQTRGAHSAMELAGAGLRAEFTLPLAADGATLAD